MLVMLMMTTTTKMTTTETILTMTRAMNTMPTVTMRMLLLPPTAVLPMAMMVRVIVGCRCQ